MNRDEWVEIGARAESDFDGREWIAMPRVDRERYLSRLRVILAALEPLIRADERERAAKIAEVAFIRWEGQDPCPVVCDITACEEIAAAIRAGEERE